MLLLFILLLFFQQNQPITLFINRTDAVAAYDLDPLIEGLEANLQAHDLHLKTQYTLEQANIVLTVDKDHHVFVGIPESLPLNLPESPLIEPQLGFSVIFEPHDVVAIVNYMTGNAFLSMGNCETAFTYFESVRAAEVSAGVYAAMHFFEGVCAVESGDYLLAVDLLDAAYNGWHSSEGQPLLDNAAYMLGWLYVQQGDEKAALAVLDQAVQGSSPALSLMRRAQLYALVFDFERAVEDMDAAIHLQPQNPLFYVERGKVILLLYEWDHALRDFNRALKIDPGFAPAYFQRGILYYSLLERESALNDFTRYLALDPDGEFADAASHSIKSIRAELESLEPLPEATRSEQERNP